MWIALIVACLLIVPHAASAQEGTIAGTVCRQQQVVSCPA